MSNLIRTVFASAGLYGATAVAAAAQSYNDYFCRYFGIYCGPVPDHAPAPTNVPEIDVSSGLLAVAAVTAMLVLAWELKRRRA